MKTQLVALASVAMVGVGAQHVEAAAAATVSGTVLKQGSGVSGATVTIIGGGDGDVVMNTTSGAGGSYLFSSVGDGRYTVYASGTFNGVTWSGQTFVTVFFGFPVQANVTLAPQF